MHARSALFISILALCGCASAPFDPASGRSDIAPLDAASAPQRAAERVIWGGMVIAVDNRPNSSELVVLGYPLDSRQRPLLKRPNVGRFIAVLPGYVEPYDYPQGRFVTVRGTIAGTREALIDESPYVYPLLSSDAVHLWPEGFQNSGPRFSFGIGISR